MVLFGLGFSATVSANTIGEITGNSVNVRSAPELIDTNRIMQVNRGQSVEILGAARDFFHVVVDDTEAFIHQDFVRIISTAGTVLNDHTRVYSLPGEDGEFVASFPLNATVTAISVYENWLGILFGGETAFVSQVYVDIPEFVTLPTARVGHTVADEIIERALTYLGTPYRWGGMSARGFDCSGFVNYLFNPHGISLSRRSVDMASNGVHVDRDDIIPGDLLFFATAGGRRVSHVALYIGNGQIIHATTFGTGVMINDLSNDYYIRTFVTARRVLP